MVYTIVVHLQAKPVSLEPLDVSSALGPSNVYRRLVTAWLTLLVALNAIFSFSRASSRELTTMLDGSYGPSAG